ncbi:MAG: hypothetical protein HY063_08585, partial [Bacteroidetes bacterium]|nr:hypothetical protein [Bacteroidota bacterium]
MKKTFTKGLIAIIVIALQTNFSQAQFTQGFLSGNLCGSTNPAVTAIGIGNFSTSPSAALHVNTNLLPTNTTFGAGKVFRTDGPSNVDNLWQMFTVPTGKNPVTKEIGDILSPAGSIDFMMRSAQPGGTLQFQTNTG